MKVEELVELSNRLKALSAEGVYSWGPSDMVDKPNENGKLGTYDQEEVTAAIKMLDISKKKKDQLWSSKYKTTAPNW